MLNMILFAMTAAGPTDAAPPSDLESARSIELFGLRICTAAEQDPSCDVQIFSGAQDDGEASEGEAPMTVSILGRTLCMGAVPDDIACDVHLSEEVGA